MDTPYNEPAAPVVIAENPLRCLHCCHDRFFTRRRILTPEMRLSDFGLADRAVTYVCSRCGRIEWFMPPEMNGIMDSTEGDFDCLECGGVIPNGRKDCPACGWSYGAGK